MISNRKLAANSKATGITFIHLFMFALMLGPSFRQEANAGGRQLAVSSPDGNLTIARTEKVVKLFRELRKKLLTKYTGDIA